MPEPMPASRLAELLDQHMAVVAHLGEMNAMPLGARWRLITGDSYTDDCIGPVCPHQDAHQRLDDGTPDVRGQFDCCPYPVIECHTDLIAAWLVELLNSAPALINAVIEARKPKPPSMADAFEMFRAQVLAEEQPDE